MPKISISLADRIESDIDRLVEQGEFVNRDQAVEELLTMGVSAYETTEESTDLAEDDLFSQTVEDQQDPAIHDDDPDEGYTF
ncbi:ribbon-helix-helix domain-containing protein [Halorhabdus salina]|uniref:ribbon-helix-helix domain-containing protein n=1 Tax=Halorhabdus salina TaxID=2750670 RepID=UPI0015EEA580|nr:ribbon-helix-helix domain-containing protein [Halorhabdus salina]